MRKPSHYLTLLLIMGTLCCSPDSINSRDNGQLIKTSELGGKWKLKAMNGKDPVVGNDQIPEFTLNVGEGSIVGFDGCNRFRGRIEEFREGSIRITVLGSTRMSCRKNQLAARFMAKLQQVRLYQLLEGDLILMNGNDTLVLKREE